MPQLEVATFYSQIFWLIICLTILYFSLRHIFIPRIESSIAKRQKRIEAMILDAQKMQLEANLINQKYEEEVKRIYLNSAEIHKTEILKFEKKCEEKLDKLSISHNKKLDLLAEELDEVKKEFSINLDEKVSSTLKILVGKLVSKEEQRSENG